MIFASCRICSPFKCACTLNCLPLIIRILRELTLVILFVILTRDSPVRLTGDKTTAGVCVAQKPHVVLRLILNFATCCADCLCMFVLRQICREVSAKFANVLVELAVSNASAAEQLKPFSVSDSAHVCGWKRCYDHLNDKIVTAINNHSLKQALCVIGVLQDTFPAFDGILNLLESTILNLDYPRLQAEFNTFVALHYFHAVSWTLMLPAALRQQYIKDPHEFLAVVNW